MDKKITSKSQARLDKIKQIAAESFLKNGYEATNLKDIIKEAGGSFSSVYQHYKNKEGLFEAILNDFTKNHFLKIFNETMNIKENENLEDFLHNFALAYLGIFNNTKTIAIVRLLYSEIYNEKIDFAKWLKGNNKAGIEFMLQQRFAKENKKLAKNAKFLSYTFCAMLRGSFFIQSTFENKVLMDKKEQKAHAKKIVKLFTQGLVSFN
ncbi:multidrug efflux system CmeABC transcriptional regulator, TetR family [Campylobacter volucris]|uniref:Multidrug efflux system CmeABC transcriptional regulator, TetR family n=1 Tax=Campylobacter volucris TaxID=1031542 RepID=A0AAE5YGH6_9BACT|nr:TetR/AcrR family transcriptional regulator [Campylobacter volucris]AJC94819.1 multidrug efflux system CmeABC transcriptional regulator, TetR family [Campylobacter volucris LMG 24379]KAB0579671.1 multidrug efflux system CmeABC transcriptional regulator, TetR family [Campylobacter volucris]QBL12837.1 multidrug efflux system CmeABC transcriptional regulator, TetR family [Campylobacter volucris]QEL09037.1 multidrug efflux system CmeABC transcriptional regulator, TetR family [Campylobacter volucr